MGKYFLNEDADRLLRGGRRPLIPSIASLTKPTTASAILASERAGRLLRTDKVNRLLAYAEPAPTVDELIKHIPGLPNFQNTAACQNGYTSPTTLESLLSLIQPWDGIQRYQYSNKQYEREGLRDDECLANAHLTPAAGAGT